jgi:hypothetical protein
VSSDLVYQIHLRLRGELDRLGLKLADASRKAGEVSAQRLKDVVSGRQKCPAELVARLAVTGIDVLYVLTGENAAANAATSQHLQPDEQLLLDAYRGLNATKKKQLLISLLTGDVAKKPPKSDGGVSVRGSGNRTAGRDYHE